MRIKISVDVSFYKTFFKDILSYADEQTKIEIRRKLLGIISSHSEIIFYLHQKFEKLIKTNQNVPKTVDDH